MDILVDPHNSTSITYIPNWCSPRYVDRSSLTDRSAVSHPLTAALVLSHSHHNLKGIP